MLERIRSIWGQLPKTAKVFFYLAISTILGEILIELQVIEQTVIVRILAQLINLVIVFLQESVPALQARLRR